MHQHGDEYLPRGALNCVEAAITERLGADDFCSAGREQLFVGVRMNRNRGYRVGRTP